MEKKRVLTKRAMRLSSTRLPEALIDIVIAACRVEGVSRSEFFRAALREKAIKVISDKRGSDSA